MTANLNRPGVREIDEVDRLLLDGGQVEEICERAGRLRDGRMDREIIAQMRRDLLWLAQFLRRNRVAETNRELAKMKKAAI
jgi:hypothetical protein